MNALLYNTLFLSLLQFLNYLIPFLTFPYLISVLGFESFGVLSLATACMVYFTLLTDYGFNFSATQQIAQSRADLAHISRIVSSVFVIKLLLLMLSALLLSLALWLFSDFFQQKIIYLLSFGVVIGSVLMPVWFFQGIEQMKHLLYLNILFKGGFTLSIFFLVTQPEDTWLVPTLTALGFIGAGIGGLLVMLTQYKVRLTLPTQSELVLQLKSGYHLFISTISISLYTSTVTVLLGIFTNAYTVGVFSAAERFITALSGLINPLSQALYPVIARMALQSHSSFGRLFGYVILIVALVYALVTFVLYHYAPLIVPLALGSVDRVVIQLVVLMSLIPFLVALSNVFGILIMTNFGYKAMFSRILMSASVFGVVLTSALIWFNGALGAALSLVCVEAYVTIFMFVFLWLEFKSGRLFHVEQ